MAEELKVNPAELRKYASDMQKIQSTYSNLLTQAEDETKKLRPIWTGAAAEQYMSTFTTVKTKCTEYIETLRQTIEALNETAENYERNIEKIKSAAEDLPKLSENTMI